MVPELKLKGCSRLIKPSCLDFTSFSKPLIFYLANKQDVRSFFVTFVIVDFLKNEIQYLFSYNEENIGKINELPDNDIFSMTKNPHCTLSINKDGDFLTFVEDEEFFFYVSQKKMIMKVYTMNDLVKDSDIKFKRISSTFYKDDRDPSFFYMSAVDSSEILHVFRVSLDLNDIEEIDSFPSTPFPPHVVRKHKDFLLLSHEFRYAKFELQKTGKIVNNNELASIYLRSKLRLLGTRKDINKTGYKKAEPLSPEEASKLFELLDEEYSIKCLPGNILLLNTKTKEKIYYGTSGGCPAHFEIDIENDIVYTSSHNFILPMKELVYLAPAVIDKFRLVEGKLELIGSFSHPKGFRYTTHKIFYYGGKPYICVFGQPNRLMFIDATKMELLYYTDIGEDELTSQSDVRSYLKARTSEFEIIAVEVTQNGENIIFVGPQYIYLYNFPQRELLKKIDYKSFNMPDDEMSLNEYRISTSHFNYLY